MNPHHSQITPASPSAAKGALLALFEAFPADRGEGTLAVGTYLIAIEGYSIQAIEGAVKRIIRGEADGIDKRFLPTPAQLGNLVAYMEKLYAPATPRQALPAPGSETLTEEDLRRRRAMAERIKAQFGVPGVKREPVPTPAEEFDAWEKRELERLATEGLPKLSPHIVEDTKRKLADAKRIAEALIAAEEAAETRRQKLAKQSPDLSVRLPPTIQRNGEAA